MTEIFRLEIQKREATRYVGHLDFGRALERALRRAKLPVAFSVGFNPHMKISFGPALGVGIASEAEYLDVELEESCPEEEFFQRLSQQMPPGLGLAAARKTESRKSLAAALNLAEYRVDVCLPSQDEFSQERVQNALQQLALRDSLMFLRCSPKGNKTVEVLDYLYDPPKWEKTAEGISLSFRLRMKATGALKPQEFMQALIQQLDFPTGEMRICRTALWAETESGFRTAYEI